MIRQLMVVMTVVISCLRASVYETHEHGEGEVGGGVE